MYNITIAIIIKTMDEIGYGYFKCRQCGTVGQWHTHRMQAQHLRQCPGHMLFDKFETGRTNKKRQCMEMVAAQPTGIQLQHQIENEIHASHADGTVRTAQTLATMPSIRKLAQPWDENNSSEYNFVDFGGANNNEWEEVLDEEDVVEEEQHNHFKGAQTGNRAGSMKHWSNIELCEVGNVKVPVETSMCTKYASLPGVIVYQLHMMHIMNKHRGVDLKMYSEINECVGYHAREKNVDFRTTKMYTCLLYTSPSPRDRQKSRMPSSA